MHTYLCVRFRYILFYSSIWKVSLFCSFSKSNWPFWRCTKTPIRFDCQSDWVLSTLGALQLFLKTFELFLRSSAFYFVIESTLEFSIHAHSAKRSKTTTKAILKKFWIYIYILTAFRIFFFFCPLFRIIHWSGSSSRHVYLCIRIDKFVCINEGYFTPEKNPIK